MATFASAFLLTLLHSTWQMALLMLLYWLARPMVSKWPPLARRNILLHLLCGQLILSLVNFFILVGQPHSLMSLHTFSIVNTTGSWLNQHSGWLLFIYMLAFVYKILIALKNWGQLKKLRSSAFIKPPAHIRSFTQNHAALLGIKSRVTVWLSTQVQSPLVFGFYKPIILLPVAIINQLSLAQTEALLLHELTHLKQQDYLINWALVAMDSIYWFNPFVKMAIRILHTEREKNCDLNVLQFKYTPVQYAEALLWVATQAKPSTALSMAALGSKPELLNRIQYFSANKTGFPSKGNNWLLPIFMIGSIALLNMFLVGTKLNTAVTAKSALKLSESKYWAKSLTPISAAGASVESTFENRSSSPEFKSELKSAHSEDKNPGTIAPPVASTRPILSPMEEVTENNNPDTEPLIAEFAALDETHPSKDIIITEQNSAGKTTTIMLRFMQNSNGEWKAHPLWMSTEQTLTDSLRKLIQRDSAVLKIIPTVQ